MNDLFTVPDPTVPREQVGAVFLRAIVDLGWWPWFEQAAAAQAVAKPNGPGKPVDQRFWQTIGKTDLVPVDSPALCRVAKGAEAARVAASGQPAPAVAVITLAAVMDHGNAMTAAGA